MLDKSPTFDSNSKNLFHTSTDSCGVRPPDDNTRSNNTRVLLSSENEHLNKFKKLLAINGIITGDYRSNEINNQHST